MDIITKKLFVFDLDGTLAESKLPIDSEMQTLLEQLLTKASVAVIGGGRYDLFQKQLLERLTIADELLKHLYLFPNCATRFYYYKHGEWQQVYAEELTPVERVQIRKAIEDALVEVGYVPPTEVYGEVIEDRGTQMTFSPMGQEATISQKEWWRDTYSLRPAITSAVARRLPGYSVLMGGITSIDITRRGIDKAYGIEQMKKHLGVSIADMLFVGDAMYEGGNDAAVKRTGVDWFVVSGPEETKKLIREWLSQITLVDSST